MSLLLLISLYRKMYVERIEMFCLKNKVIVDVVKSSWLLCCKQSFRYSFNHFNKLSWKTWAVLCFLGRNNKLSLSLLISLNRKMYVERIKTFCLKNKVIVVEPCLDTSFKEYLEKINVKHGTVELNVCLVKTFCYVENMCSLK